jgi:hypothetical protein
VSDVLARGDDVSREHDALHTIGAGPPRHTHMGCGKHCRPRRASSDCLENNDPTQDPLLHGEVLFSGLAIRP